MKKSYLCHFIYLLYKLAHTKMSGNLKRVGLAHAKISYLLTVAN